MPFIKPGPGELWCPCCELTYVPTRPKQTMCSRAECLVLRPAWRAGKYCLECGNPAPKHTPKCRRMALIEIGRPEGPCPTCGGYPLAHTKNCRVAEFVAACRNGGTCHICGRKLDLYVRYPDKDSLTSDHIVPISLARGVKKNRTVAHRRCNEWRGNSSDSRYQPSWGVFPDRIKSESRLPKMEPKHPRRGGGTWARDHKSESAN